MDGTMDQKDIELGNLRARVHFLENLIDTKTQQMADNPDNVRFTGAALRKDAGLPAIAWAAR